MACAICYLFCCLPPCVYTNYPEESWFQNLLWTLWQIRSDQKQQEIYQEELSMLGFEEEKLNQAISYRPPAEMGEMKTDDRPLSLNCRYLGHSSFDIVVNGRHFLFDPAAKDVTGYSRRAPSFFDKDNIPINKIIGIVISHNHDDHRDWLEENGPLLSAQPPIFVGEGSEWPREWGYQRVYELRWNEGFRIAFDNVVITMTGVPAQHGSARKGYGCLGYLPTAIVNQELWLGYFIEIDIGLPNGKTEKFNVYYAGDTAMGSHFVDVKGKKTSLAEIVSALAIQKGGMHYMFIQVGPYEIIGPEEDKSPFHMGPEEVVLFSGEIIDALEKKKMPTPLIVPIHDFSFGYNKPRGADTMDFLQRAVQNNALKSRVIPIAFGADFNLQTVYRLPPEQRAAALRQVCDSCFNETSVFKNHSIRVLYGLKEIPSDEKIEALDPTGQDLASRLMNFSV